MQVCWFHLHRFVYFQLSNIWCLTMVFTSSSLTINWFSNPSPLPLLPLVVSGERETYLKIWNHRRFETWFFYLVIFNYQSHLPMTGFGLAHSGGEGGNWRLHSFLFLIFFLLLLIPLKLASYSHSNFNQWCFHTEYELMNIKDNNEK